MSDPAQAAAHTASIGAVIASVFGWLPPVIASIASLAAATYYAVQIYESETCQRFIRWVAAVRRSTPVKPTDPDQSGPEIL